jgi:hypothetical protein
MLHWLLLWVANAFTRRRLLLLLLLLLLMWCCLSHKGVWQHLVAPAMLPVRLYTPWYCFVGTAARSIRSTPLQQRDRQS